jgi:hypothetical protein
MTFDRLNRPLHVNDRVLVINVDRNSIVTFYATIAEITTARIYLTTDKGKKFYKVNSDYLIYVEDQLSTNKATYPEHYI